MLEGLEKKRERKHKWESYEARVGGANETMAHKDEVKRRQGQMVEKGAVLVVLLYCFCTTLLADATHGHTAVETLSLHSLLGRNLRNKNLYSTAVVASKGFMYGILYRYSYKQTHNVSQDVINRCRDLTLLISVVTHYSSGYIATAFCCSSVRGELFMCTSLFLSVACSRTPRGYFTILLEVHNFTTRTA